MVSQFGVEITQQKLIIRRFDEVLLEKASKFDIFNLQKIIPTLVPRIEFTEFSDTMKNSLGTQDSSISMLKSEISDNFSYCTEYIKQVWKELATQIRENLSVCLRKEFVAREEFDLKLQQKADDGQYDQALQKKSDKCIDLIIIYSWYNQEFE